ncbi:hypothetical protein phiAS5_ORF0321 [Aeromonas phage phiAS5]|uniref:Uncharacterized protein n=1 Tax=Aeromonas phage phiAS5 TaxID=879630 RepID=E1A275_9CAUD|nr:tail fiber chaperone [Aeromonas phage phiAS5]ADM80164.1 hypothetical protein phiAS5_ORF0321 [Aeromonas phage phiAS5]BES53074.1 hypothetical protein [Aeromonas phage phiWae14]
MQEQVQQLQSQLNTLKVRLFDAQEARTQEAEFYQGFFGQLAKELGLEGEAATQPEAYIAKIVELKSKVPVEVEAEVV